MSVPSWGLTWEQILCITCMESVTMTNENSIPVYDSVKIESFQILLTTSEKDPATHNINIIGKGSDGWMYQYFGEEACWSRISQSVPKKLFLPGYESLSSIKPAEVKEEPTIEPSSEAGTPGEST